MRWGPIMIAVGVFLVAASLALGGCAHGPAPEPEIQTIRVEVPVPVPCNPKPPEATPYPDTAEALLAAPDIFSQVRLLMAGRALRPANEAAIHAAYAECVGKKKAAPHGAAKSVSRRELSL